MPLGEAGHPHQSRRQWGLQCFCKLDQFFRGIGQGRPSTDIKNRFLGRQQHLDSLVDLPGVAGIVRLVATNFDRLRVLKSGRSGLNVLGQVDHHRTGTAGTGNEEGLFDDTGQVLDVLDQVVVFSNGAGDPHDIGFLEGIVTDQRRRHLSGNDHHGNRIHVGGGNPGDGVGRAGTAGRNRHANLATDASIAVSRMNGGLFMTGQDVLDGIVHQVVVDIDYRPAGVAEHRVHPFLYQTFQ